VISDKSLFLVGFFQIIYSGIPVGSKPGSTGGFLNVKIQHPDNGSFSGTTFSHYAQDLTRIKIESDFGTGHNALRFWTDIRIMCRSRPFQGMFIRLSVDLGEVAYSE
jgi:hypothetical protein